MSLFSPQYTNKLTYNHVHPLPVKQCVFWNILCKFRPNHIFSGKIACRVDSRQLRTLLASYLCLEEAEDGGAERAADETLSGVRIMQEAEL